MSDALAPGDVPDWHTDPERARWADLTGVYVRALRDGRWDSVDMAELDRDSLVAFARSRGPVSTWAIHLLLIVLGHDREGARRDRDADG